MGQNIRSGVDNKRIISYAALFLLLVFLAVNNYIWLRLNKISPFWDESRHMIIAISYADAIRNFPRAADAIKIIETLESFLNLEHSYPPLFHLTAIPLSLSLGNTLDILAMNNVIFLAVLLFSVFKIGERLFDARVGLLAAFISAMSPMVFGTSRMFMLEFPAAAMICLGIYLLLLTASFGSRKYSLLFGIGIGLGMLTREAFLIHLLGPTTCILYGIFSKPDLKKAPRITNFILAAAAGCAIALPHYFRTIFYYSSGCRGAFIKYLSRIFLFLNPSASERVISLLIFLAIAILSLRRFRLILKRHIKAVVLIFLIILNVLCWSDWKAILPLTWYAYNLKDQLGLPFLVFFLACLPGFWRNGKHKAFLLSWIIVPYCFFTLLFFNDYLVRWQPRFTVPYLPAIALISAFSVFNIKNKRLRILSVYLILIAGLINFFNVSFGLPLKHGANNKIVRLLTQPDGANWWLIHRPVRDNYWKVPEILKWIHGDMRKTGKEKIVIDLIVDTGEINPETLYYYILVNHFPFEVYSRAEATKLSEVDYVICLSRPQDWHWDLGHEREAILGLYAAFKEKRKDFVLVQKFKKSDNALFIFRKRSDRD